MLLGIAIGSIPKTAEFAANCALAYQFPSHVVCDWLGNSEDIARKHYYQATDDHFARTTAEQDEAKQKLNQLKTVSNGGESQSESANAVSAEKSGSVYFPAISEADGEGLEPVSLTTCDGNISIPGEADCEAVRDTLDVQVVVEAWSTLPKGNQDGILAMVASGNLRWNGLCLRHERAR